MPNPATSRLYSDDEGRLPIWFANRPVRKKRTTQLGQPESIKPQLIYGAKYQEGHSLKVHPKAYAYLPGTHQVKRPLSSLALR